MSDRRLQEEALSDPKLAVRALRHARREADHAGFGVVMRAHMVPRDVAETVWIAELPGVTFWMQTTSRVYVWADVCCLREACGFAWSPKAARHYTNAPKHLRASCALHKDASRNLERGIQRLYKRVFDTALVELQRQDTIVTLVGLDLTYCMWSNNATDKERVRHYVDLELAEAQIGLIPFYEMTRDHADRWIQWYQHPDRPWHIPDE